MSIKVTVILDNVRKVMDSMRSLELKEVLVGIPSENAGRDDGPKTNADIGYIHENGAPNANIPPRPFLEPGIQESKGQYSGYLENAAREALDGNAGGMEADLNRAGIVASQAVKNKFTDNSWPPLKRPRSHKGRSYRDDKEQNDRPLLDTGALRNSITYVIRRKKR